MEPISVAIANQNVTCIGDIDSIWETCDLFAANATLELARFVEHSNAVALKVADIEVVSCFTNENLC